LVKGQNSIPLPPINAPNNSDATMFHEDQLDQEPFGDDYCTIHPLNERPSRTSNSRGLPTLKEKGHKNKVPEWLGRNDNPYNHHKTIASRLEPKSRSRSRPHLQHMSHKQESDDEKSSNVSAVMKHSKPPPNIDLVDLQYRPENSSLEIVNHRKTQKLISTDLSNVVTQDAQVKHGTLQTTLQKSVKGTKNRGSPSNTRLNLSSSDSSPRSKNLELRKKWLKPTEGETLFSDFKHDSTQPVLEASDDGNKQKKLLPLRSSGTRSSKSNSSATARNSANENKRTSRPKFVANTLTANKKKSTKTRCGVCNKKVNITNTFGCRCSKIFCPKHRHPELHGCTFDYRTEGRKQLEEANPVVILPKLPKI